MLRLKSLALVVLLGLSSSLFAGSQEVARVLSSRDVQELQTLVRRAFRERTVLRVNDRSARAMVTIHRDQSVYNPAGRLGYLGARARLDVRGDLDTRGRLMKDSVVLHVRANANMRGKPRALHTVWVYLDPKTGAFRKGFATTVRGADVNRAAIKPAHVIKEAVTRREVAYALRLAIRWLRDGVPAPTLSRVSRLIARGVR